MSAILALKLTKIMVLLMWVLSRHMRRMRRRS